MLSRLRAAVLAATLALVLAGCVGGSPGAAVDDGASTTASTHTTTPTRTAGSCILDRPSLDVSVEKPGELTSESAEGVALLIERQHANEWLGVEDPAFFNLITHGVEVTETVDGYAVSLELAAHYEPSDSTIEHVNRPYATRYVVTAESVARDGETVVCW